MKDLSHVEQRRADRRAAHDAALREQEAVDLEAIDALEGALGAPLCTMSTSGFVLGAPVKIAFRVPSPVEYKRYVDMVGKAHQKDDPTARKRAQEMLAEACLVYPPVHSDSDGSRRAMLEAFPGVLISLAIEAAKSAELRNDDEGKD